MKRSVLLILLVMAGVIHIRAQSIAPSTLNAAGGGGTLAGNYYDWSVGEMTMVSTFTGASVIVTQGVLQPYRIVPTSVSNQGLAERLRVFPNPASSVVNLEYTSSTRSAVSYRLLDMQGRVIRTGLVDVRPGTVYEQLDITSLACSTYMLEVSVSDEGKTATQTTYKIEKIK